MAAVFCPKCGVRSEGPKCKRCNTVLDVPPSESQEPSAVGVRPPDKQGSAVGTGVKIAIVVAVLIAGGVVALTFLAQDEGASLADLGPPAVESLGLSVITSDMPESPAGERLTWLLEEARDGGDHLTEAEFRAAFEPETAAATNRDEIAQLVRWLGSRGTSELVGFADSPTDNRLVGVVRVANRYARVRVTVEQAAPHRVIGMDIGSFP